MSSYPPEPWHLTAHAYVGIFLVPRADLPDPDSPRTSTVTLFGRGVVCAAFFVYEKPSPLTYREIMATLLVRKGWRAMVPITRIWVDSVASRDGGRELWGIPKELANFDVEPHHSYRCADSGTGIAALDIANLRGAVSLPLHLIVAQDLHGAYKRTAVAGRPRLGLARAQWHVNADGPLGYLAGRKPVLTLAVRRSELSFGSD